MSVLDRIRSKVGRGASVIGLRDVSELLKMHDAALVRNAELTGEIEMWKANADEAALTAARLQARVAQLESAGEHLFEQLAKDVAFEELKRQYIARLSPHLSQEYHKLSQ